jgi:hypothetical protein
MKLAEVFVVLNDFLFQLWRAEVPENRKAENYSTIFQDSSKLLCRKTSIEDFFH